MVVLGDDDVCLCMYVCVCVVTLTIAGLTSHSRLASQSHLGVGSGWCAGGWSATVTCVCMCVRICDVLVLW